MTTSLAALAVAACATTVLICGVGLEAQPMKMTVRVIVSERDNLQYMSFWVALGAGFFRDEGVEVRLARRGEATDESLVLGEDGEAEVLAPPRYLEMIADEFPLTIVANLLQNDAVNLVVRRSVVEERKLSAKAPVAERLKGLRVGVAPNPRTRLRALFAAYGMDADREVEMVVLRKAEQNEGFGNGRVDALYAHTPFLEKALIEQDAVMLINQSAGEIPRLAARQIHTLAFARRYAEENPSVVAAMVRAIARAQRLIREDQAAAVEALLRQFPTMDRRKVETIVGIYAPAIPATPRVSPEGLKAALALFPATREAPDLSGIDLRAFFAPRFAEAATGR